MLGFSGCQVTSQAPRATTAGTASAQAKPGSFTPASREGVLADQANPSRSASSRQRTLSEELRLNSSPESLAEKRPNHATTIPGFPGNEVNPNGEVRSLIQVGFQDNPPAQSRGSAQESQDAQASELPPALPLPIVNPSLPSIPTGPTNSGVLPLEELNEASPVTAITLEQVLDSVQNHFPLLIAAAAEQQVADGKALAARGAFDLQAKASTLNQPLGFYQNYRAGAILNQPIYETGGYVYGGYKLGRGDFPTWYKERQTDGNGEYAVGLGVPLLKDRQIDKRRAELFQADLSSLAVEPMVRSQLILFSRDAAYAYWYWVALGQTLQVARNQLELAEARVQQIALRVERGDLPEIASIDNDRFIASRQTKLIEANRKFQAAAIKLSLFLRTPDGEPLLPDTSQLPADFPPVIDFPEANFEADLAEAVASRPEIRELDLELEKIGVELAAAQNQMLPKLDAIVEASKDIGTPASVTEDKTPFELEAGLLAEVPLQRREARGKFRSAQGKQAQLLAKRDFVYNKITTGLQDAYSAILNAHDRYEQALKNKELAIRSLEIGRRQFQVGDIDLIVLNIYEQAEAEAELQVIDAEADYFSALADYHAALGQAR